MVRNTLEYPITLEEKLQLLQRIEAEFAPIASLKGPNPPIGSIWGVVLHEIRADVIELNGIRLHTETLRS